MKDYSPKLIAAMELFDEDKPDGCYWSVFGAYIDSVDFCDFKYWMPLPQPPEDQE